MQPTAFVRQNRAVVAPRHDHGPGHAARDQPGGKVGAVAAMLKGGARKLGRLGGIHAQDTNRRGGGVRDDMAQRSARGIQHQIRPQCRKVVRQRQGKVVGHTGGLASRHDHDIARLGDVEDSAQNGIGIRWSPDWPGHDETELPACRAIGHREAFAGRPRGGQDHGFNAAVAQQGLERAARRPAGHDQRHAVAAKDADGAADVDAAAARIHLRGVAAQFRAGDNMVGRGRQIQRRIERERHHPARHGEGARGHHSHQRSTSAICSSVQPK